MGIGSLHSGTPGQRLLSFSCLEQSDKGTSESPVAFLPMQEKCPGFQAWEQEGAP